MTDPAKLLFFSNSFNSFENSEYFVTTKPHDWNEKNFLLWLDKNGEDLFAGSRTLQDRIMKWHIHFLKVLKAVISNCKSFLDNPTRITTEDDELRSYASAAMNKAVFLNKNLKKIPSDVSEWWNQRELENFKGREKLIMAQDSLSQVSWTAARNEKTRKRFWEIDALGDDGTKHDEQAGRDFPEKRTKIDYYFQRKQDQIPRTPPHQIGVSRAFQEDSEQIQAHDNISKDSNPEDDTSEYDLLMESPVGIAMDCKLIVKNICVRSKMEQCRRSLRYVEEIHKQDLMRYNILDTTSSSATEARKIFKESWDDIISTIEGFLMSASTSPSSSFSTSNLTDQDTEHDGQAEEIKQYLNAISKNVNTAEKLRNTVKTKLLTDGKTKWKRRVLQLMKIFRDQFPDGRNCLKEDQTEYNYIITFISHIFTTLFKDRMPSVRYKWGESTLKCSAILLNQSIKDDDRRCTGNKIDAILSMVELDLEFSTLEVSGSPSSLDHTHYVGDRNKTAKMLKVILNFIKTKYQGDFEKFRKIKVYGIQIYDHDFYIYSLCMPFAGVYYFKLEKKFSYPTMTFLLFKDLPIFALNLWKMRDMITLSTENIIDYVTSAPTEFCNDDTVIDKVKSSPRKKKNKSVDYR